MEKKDKKEKAGSRGGGFVAQPLVDLRGSPDADHLHGHLVGKHLNGQPGWSAKEYVGVRQETAEQKRAAHQGNCFNVLRSDSLPLDRPVPDAAPPGCREAEWGKGLRLPRTSVVFVFFNEPLSPLLRSIHSVFDRTPPELLEEVVLVDDGSSAPWLREPLEEYLKLLPRKTLLVRLANRTGLMGARTAGARAAKGETVTFLDSHVECGKRWLEPLLHRVAEDRRHVVMPVIDAIGADDFQYTPGGIDILGFHWGMGHAGLARGGGGGDATKARESPIMAGGLFAMDRALFFELGAYDAEMREYGGEEFELSFKIWQCGNTLENVPCSRVGHIFRSKEHWQGQAYPVDGRNVQRNKLRTAEVWMDEYARLPKLMMPSFTPQQLGPLDEMRALRQRLGCKPFKWYLQRVFPELAVPVIHLVGEFRNAELTSCLDTLGSDAHGQPIGAYPCHGQSGSQLFSLTAEGHLQIPLSGFSSCVEPDSRSKQLVYAPCRTKWTHEPSTGTLSFVPGWLNPAPLCLTALPSPSPKSPHSLVLQPCNSDSPTQHWVITSTNM